MVPTMVNYRENRPKRQIETPWGRAALNVNQVVSRGLARDAKGTATLGPWQPARGSGAAGAVPASAAPNLNAASIDIAGEGRHLPNLDPSSDGSA
jgi:hypothetical protein